MRQAGRSLPEYRALRATNSMMQACFDADLITEITLQPVRRHDVDAAILFSDIVVPLKAIGVGIDIAAGVGPVLEQPIRDAAGLSQLRDLEAVDVATVSEAIGKLRAELVDKTLIGFAGAPFTLASYAIEGGPSRTYINTKKMMYGNPELWHQLMDRLAHITGQFLQHQITAGVQVVQLFDSWAGALNAQDYREFVLPHSQKALSYAQGVPTIHFGVGTGELLEDMSQVGSSVMGVDYKVDFASAINRLGADRVYQGNLDPAILFAPWNVIEKRAREILDAGSAARGHIFNLGHGVMPETDPEVITRLTAFVKSYERA
jgi:uroporphyrinogen decarboxylase